LCGVSQDTVCRWIEWFGWHARADARDAAVKAKADRDAVGRRLRMQQKHREAGEALRQRGVEHLVHNKIASARDAIAAVKAGVDIERTAEGLPTDILAMMSADADTIDTEIEVLLARRLAAAGDPPEDPRDEGGGEEGCLASGE